MAANDLEAGAKWKPVGVGEVWVVDVRMEKLVG